jgi:fructokinase
LGRISSDGFGQQIRERLSSNGVNLDYSISAKEQTSLAVANIGDGGSASYSFYVDGTADWGWTESELPNAVELASLDTKAVQFGCLAMAIAPGGLVLEKWLKELYATNQMTLSHDLNIRSALGFERESELARVQRINSNSHIIKASDADIEWLYDLPLGAALDEIALSWSQGGKLVVITRGGEGATLYLNGNKLHAKAPKINLVDTVGAGDTFMANLLAELDLVGALGDEPISRLAKLDSAQLQTAAEVAAVAAGIVCERKGCEPPTLAETTARVAVQAR